MDKNIGHGQSISVFVPIGNPRRIQIQTMPVELPARPSDAELPSPPNAIVWMLLFVAYMMGGVVSTLLAWPRSEPAGSAWFWTRSLLLPALAWCMTFGLRKFYYDEEIDRLLAEQEVVEADRARAIEFAREPLAVLGLAYSCAMGAYGVAHAIATDNKTALMSRSPRPNAAPVRHTALSPMEGEAEKGRYGALFLSLLADVDDVLRDLPQGVPLDVRLQVSDAEDRELLLENWKRYWEKQHYPQATASVIEAAQGLMALDEWLDIQGGPSLEKVTLFVAAQLHAQPPENSGEAGVALIFAWPPLAERLRLKPIALVHRPVRSIAQQVDEALSTASQWGGVSATEIRNIWQAGLTARDKPPLLRVASASGSESAEDAPLSAMHDIDIALGDAGAARDWLATALAIEHAWQSGEPQLIAVRERAFSAAVVKPPAGRREMDIEQ